MEHVNETVMVNPKSICVEGIRFIPGILARVEMKARRVLLSNPNPDYPIVKLFQEPRPNVDELVRCVIKTPGESRFFYIRTKSTDRTVLKQIFFFHSYDLTPWTRFSEIRKYLERLSASGRRPLIIDAGANNGASSVFFALMFPTALVVAIEPEASNFAMLEKNTQGLNVRCIRAALASERGNVNVVDAGNGDWGFRTEKALSGTVECITINDLYEKFVDEIHVPFIVKIDIEGAEKDVFSGSTHWVERTPTIVAELHDWMLPRSGTSLPFLRCIGSLDRDFLYAGENIISIDNTMLD
jgi:FkbM family methyltransferase